MSCPMMIKLSISSHAFVRFSRAFSPHFDKGMQMQSTFLCFSTAHSKLELNSSFLTLCEKLVEQPIGTIHVVTADSLDFEETEAKVCGKRIQFASNVLPSQYIGDFS
jgi:hypothetical protein